MSENPRIEIAKNSKAWPLVKPPLFISASKVKHLKKVMFYFKQAMVLLGCHTSVRLAKLPALLW